MSRWLRRPSSATTTASWIPRLYSENSTRPSCSHWSDDAFRNNSCGVPPITGVTHVSHFHSSPVIVYAIRDPSRENAV